jgi:hypothetical protein
MTYSAHQRWQYVWNIKRLNNSIEFTLETWFSTQIQRQFFQTVFTSSMGLNKETMSILSSYTWYNNRSRMDSKRLSNGSKYRFQEATIAWNLESTQMLMQSIIVIQTSFPVWRTSAEDGKNLPWIDRVTEVQGKPYQKHVGSQQGHGGHCWMCLALNKRTT